MAHQKDDDMFSKGSVKQKYDLGDELGKGNYSVVYMATDKDDKSKWACKVIQKKNAGKKGMDMVKTEIKILKAASHPNIVRLKEAFETETECYLMMELISGGELFDKIVELSSYSEKDASRIVRQMVDAVAHLHSKNIVHRDLKPENLLLESDSATSDIRLADFGLSKFLDPKDPLNVPVGTPGYVAPEVVECLESSETSYGKEIDLWAIGVITYILLCGYPPFYSEDDDEVFDQILEGKFEYPSPHWDSVSASAKDLINKLLVLDPKKRMTAADALKHPWVKGHEVSADTLSSAITELKKFNAKRKWKGAILATVAMNRLSAKLKQLHLNSSHHENLEHAGGGGMTGLLAKLKAAHGKDEKKDG